MSWETVSPQIYSVVTGFFPEAEPKGTWATNPRPLLVCGVAVDASTDVLFCRVAYGTKQVKKARQTDLVIGNLSILNELELKYPTCFVIHRGAQMAILPWTDEFFQPWTGYATPVLGLLPEDMQRYVGNVLVGLTDLPQF